MKEFAYLYSPEEAAYRFSDSHPFNPIRLELTLSLLEATGALETVDCIVPRPATDEELSLIHDADYIQAVKLAGHGELSPMKAQMYGLGTEDTPLFDRMHESAALLVGGTIEACELVLSGQYRRTFHIGGGLHHGFRGRASGFCIYNDTAVAMAAMIQKYDCRILYVDTDAHHGDGVQWAFYNRADVMTLSLHETGRYLFPGTGMVTERGAEEGYGWSWNVPFDAFTEDASFLQAYRTVLFEACELFKPDLIITQNGADAHALDPLTHLSLTMESYEQIPQIAVEAADRYTDGRIVALGGGGYDWYRVVPRAWSQVFAALTNQSPFHGNLPEEWIQRWQKESPTVPVTWADPVPLYPMIPRRPEIEEKNWETVKRLLWPFIDDSKKEHLSFSSPYSND
ncbi:MULTISPECIES: acetoin utilization protein AcuC [Exiguobacterium]|uniref:acetoin utilization protein AcuC n=1 Tax=Exiguobacterium TaxID=33986 RepID=UPI001BEB7F62|nr:MULTISPECIES: acetoin utilization protein AcuC [Exiguobacterium]MCT4792226.1 acetoin utilization protein AcuC [Exiguobacterium artemiae]